MNEFLRLERGWRLYTLAQCLGQRCGQHYVQCVERGFMVAWVILEHRVTGARIVWCQFFNPRQRILSFELFIR